MYTMPGCGPAQTPGVHRPELPHCNLKHAGPGRPGGATFRAWRAQRPLPRPAGPVARLAAPELLRRRRCPCAPSPAAQPMQVAAYHSMALTPGLAQALAAARLAVHRYGAAAAVFTKIPDRGYNLKLRLRSPLKGLPALDHCKIMSCKTVPAIISLLSGKPSRGNLVEEIPPAVGHTTS